MCLMLEASASISSEFDDFCFAGGFQHAEYNAVIYLAVEPIFHDSNFAV